MLTEQDKELLVSQLRDVIVTVITNKTVNADAQTIKQVAEDYSEILGRVTAVTYLDRIDKEAVFKINAMANDMKKYISNEYMKAWGAGGIISTAKNILT